MCGNHWLCMFTSICKTIKNYDENIKEIGKHTKQAKYKSLHNITAHLEQCYDS